MYSKGDKAWQTWLVFKQRLSTTKFTWVGADVRDVVLVHLSVACDEQQTCYQQRQIPDKRSHADAADSSNFFCTTENIREQPSAYTKIITWMCIKGSNSRIIIWFNELINRRNWSTVQSLENNIIIAIIIVTFIKKYGMIKRYTPLFAVVYSPRVAKLYLSWLYSSLCAVLQPICAWYCNGFINECKSFEAI